MQFKFTGNITILIQILKFNQQNYSMLKLIYLGLTLLVLFL